MAAKKQDQVRSLREEAAELVSSGKQLKAAKLYESLAELEPSEGDWRRRAAECYRLAGKRTEQLEQLTLAARAYASTGQVLKGVAMCKLALAIDPGHEWLKEEFARLSEPRPAAPTRPGLQAGLRAPARVASPPSPPRLRDPEAAPIASSEEEPREASLPAAPPLEELDLGARLAESDAALDRRREMPRESRGMVAIDVDDILIEELAPASAHLDLEHLGEPSEPVAEPALRASALATTPLFGEVDPRLLERLIERVTLVELSAGRRVFEKGDPADAMYVIVAGQVAALSRSEPSGELLRLALLGPGDFFGEVGLLGDQPRQATIRAEEETQLLRLDRQAVAKLCEEDPRFLRKLVGFLRERLVDGLMLTSPLFTPFPPEDQATLKRLFRFVEIAEGTRVITQGQKSDGLYVLLTGKAEVLCAPAPQASAEVARGSASNPSAGETRLGLLGPGDVFGEMSLLQNRPAVASVVLCRKAFALKLPDRYFMQLLMTHPVLMEYVATLGAEREHANADLLRSGAQLRDEHIALL
jgi:CRP-like cAMP-binding protein